MIWPFRFRPTLIGLEPGDVPVRCPDCGSSRPNFRMVEMTNHAWRRSWWRPVRVIEWISGYRVACQDCPCMYSIGPDGTFRQHERSLPLSPVQAPTGMRQSVIDDVSGPRPLPPLPRPRPPL